MNNEVDEIVIWSDKMFYITKAVLNTFKQAAWLFDYSGCQPRQKKE